MSERLRDIHKELIKLKKLGPSGRKKFFKSCNKDCVVKICECIKNLLNSNLKIKSPHLKKLSRHKHTLRSLALKKTSFVQRKRLLQKGGFLAALLPALIPAVASLVSGLWNGGNDG
jgi:hypothetical protein